METEISKISSRYHPLTESMQDSASEKQPLSHEQPNHDSWAWAKKARETQKNFVNSLSENHLSWVDTKNKCVRALKVTSVGVAGFFGGGGAGFFGAGALLIAASLPSSVSRSEPHWLFSDDAVQDLFKLGVVVGAVVGTYRTSGMMWRATAAPARENETCHTCFKTVKALVGFCEKACLTAAAGILGFGAGGMAGTSAGIITAIVVGLPVSVFEADKTHPISNKIGWLAIGIGDWGGAILGGSLAGLAAGAYFFRQATEIEQNAEVVGLASA